MNNDKFETFLAYAIPIGAILIILSPIIIFGYLSSNDPDFGKTKYQLMCEKNGGYYVSGGAFSTPVCDYSFTDK